MNTLKVMTINTHKGFTSFNRRFVLPELREAISATGVDLVLMQEVLGEHSAWAEKFKANWPQNTQYEYLAETVWPEYSYGKNAVYPEGHHGNAVLSKHPIKSWNNVDIASGDAEQRGLLHNVVDVGSDYSPLHVICTHFSLREADRLNQVTALIDYAASLPKDEPLVIGGDFNDWTLSGHRKILKAGFGEAYSQVYGKPCRSFPAVFPILRLDRIYIRGIRSLAPTVLPSKPWSHLSDHRPLVAELCF